MKRFAIALSTFALAVNGMAAQANNSGSNFNINTGFGEQLRVHHGIFGLTNDTEVKDRLGDTYVNRHGLFGTKDTAVNVFGNGFRKHKGLIGGTQVQGADIFGDRIESHRTFMGFGRRTTNVNLGGVGSLVQQFVAAKRKPMIGGPGGPMGGPGPDQQMMDPNGAQGAPMPQAGDLDAAAGIGQH